MTVVGDTLFFAGQDSNSDIELWAHDTSNHTTWQVANINTLPSIQVSHFCQGTSSVGVDYFSSAPGGLYTIGDTVYFTATNGFYGRELWAYDTSNNSVWQVTRFYRCDDAGYSQFNNELYHFNGENNFNIVGDELFFIRDGGLYIHNDSTQYTKRLWTPNKHHRDSITEWRASGAVVMGDTLYGLQLYVSQPRFNNAPTDCPPISAGGCRMQGSFLYAYDSSNETLYRTAFLPGTGFSSTTGGSFHELIIASGDTILFGGGYQYVYAHQPAEISYPKERVSEANCTISPTLPAGLNFDSNQCTISGTPTAPTSQASYTVTAVINNTTYQGNVLLETSYYPIKASVTGSDAKIGTPIDDITFRIDPTVGISSGSGGNSESSGSDSSNGVICRTFSGSSSACAGTVRNWYGSDYRSDYGTGLAVDWSGMTYADAIIDPLYTDGSLGLKDYYDTAVDSNGYVHIAYLAHTTQNGIRYATNQSGSWQSFEIEQYVTGVSSIAVDSNDNVHIAYFSPMDSSGNAYANGEWALKHATNENGSWAISIVETGIDQNNAYYQYGGKDQYKIIAIDSNDNVHIAFKDGVIKIANNTDGSWTVSSVSTTTDTIHNIVIIAIDSNDGLHLVWETYGKTSYYSSYRVKVFHSTNQSGTWSNSIIDEIDTGSSTINLYKMIAHGSMVVDSNDNLHYFNYKGTFSNSGSPYRVKHFTLENGSWTNSTLKNSFCVHTSSDECSLEVVIDSNDVIHITHEISEDDVFGHNFLQYSNNANGYFGETVELEPATRVDEMVVHPNGDVDFIYAKKTPHGQGESLVLSSMNNSELNPALPMYENNKIATGYNHSCGILHDNSLVCWGSDYYGQLGDGGTNTDRPYVATYLPVDLGTDRTALAVAAGHSHTCAILDDGSLKCWGITVTDS